MNSTLINLVRNNFREGLFAETVDAVERARGALEDSGVLTAFLRSASFWHESQERLARITDRYESGEFLLNQWAVFQSFRMDFGPESESCLFELRRFVHAKALDHYTSASDHNDPDVLFRIGKCYKGIGQYDDAIESLEQAYRLKRDSAALMAELADCYSLVDEERAAKVFFREAFFLAPDEVDVDSLESPMILKLVEKIKQMGKNDTNLRRWIPVYGSIYGVLNVKRELRPLEFGKLKQSIYVLEKDLGSAATDGVSSLIPMLINHYFWLIDHYLSTHEERARIEDVLEKIKDLDTCVYRDYVN